MNYLDSLNESQSDAAQWNNGPLLVLAGPGSGKTKTLVSRVARVIEQSSGESFRILCLTFTKKAATEMRDRLALLVPNLRVRASLSTFHSFATDVLRQHGSHFGFTPDFEIIERNEQLSIVKGLLARQQGDFYLILSSEKALDSIEFLFRNLVPDDKVESSLKAATVGAQLSSLFMAYKSKLRDQNAMDYGAMLYFCEELLRARPRLSKQLRSVYKYICVDEFQDTNFAQYRMLRALAPERDANLFIVGDDDQMIYQWNGASPTRITELDQDYELRMIQLPENYRCPAEVVALANALIGFNQERAAQKHPLKAMRKQASTSPIVLEKFFQAVDESLWVAQRIAERINAGAIPSQIVVLARNTKLLESVSTKLVSLGVTTHIQRRKSQFESAPLRFLTTALKLAAVRSDREIAEITARSLSDCIGQQIQVEEFAAWAVQTNGDYLAAMGLLVAKLSNMSQDLLSAIDRLVKGSHAEFLQKSFSYFDNLEKLQILKEGSESFADYPAERDVWRGIIHDIGSESEAYELSIGQLLQEIALANKSPDAPSTAIRCLTIHASKGLEFNHVYLIGMSEDQLPSFQAKKLGDNSREMQEERRNCFVAITRTMESLTMTYANKYNGWSKPPSRFLCEMGLLDSFGNDQTCVER